MAACAPPNQGTRIGKYEIRVSHRTGAVYYCDSATGNSYWHDDWLPRGWAWGRNGSDDAPKFYVNLYTNAQQEDAPTAPAEPLPPVAAASERGRKRPRDGDVPHAAAADVVAAPAVATAVAPAAAAPRGDVTPRGTWQPAYGDSPLLSLARQEWLSWHHRRLAAAVGARWPLPGTSKSLQACRADGLLPGLQGLHARFLFSQLRAQAAIIDPLLPHTPDGLDKDTVKELVSWGIPASDAEALVVAMCRHMATAACSCAQLRDSLIEARPRVGGDAAALLPSHGSIRVLRLPPAAAAVVASHRADSIGEARRVVEGSGGGAPPAVAAPAGDADTVLLLVYEPDAAAAAKWLAPLRAAAQLPAALPYGPLNMPLYAAALRSEIADALAAAGVVRTPFTAALPLRAGHLAKLAMLYDLAEAAGVTRAGDAVAVAAAKPVMAGSAAAPVPRASDPMFINRVFCMLARYETFAGNAGGFQGALPHHVFDTLERQLGVEAECFASPLNCHFPRYCSAFADTDAPFGSMGSFFDSLPVRGAFQANPPFVNDTMLGMARRMEELLAAADAAGEQLLFFVIVPSWEDAYYYRLLSASRFTRGAGAKLTRKSHEYIDGLQHRTVTRTTWDANVDSTFFVLASGPAAAALTARHAAGGSDVGAASASALGTADAAATAFAATRVALLNTFSTSAQQSDQPGRVFQIHPVPLLQLH